ncbi:G1/S-specific cyclin-D2-like [Ischnura elegans]|uniref:G1/S-specific cyclin-D2-like n=1 Tax=Ischnura elegans TaxID=197161 RepID=UPI001ED89B30|nr:G1/S-specific cyclin-D2-like [Ischnura elegans]
MDLMCFEPERGCECRAYEDPHLVNDERVFQNMLKAEERNSPSASSYFNCVQTEVTPANRKVVAEWLLEVCEEQKCQDEVFPLAMNYVDRFLSIYPIRKCQLQLLGTACLLLASKLREPRPLAAELLVFYTDNSITIGDLWRWELMVLAKLKWDMSAVTPHDFIPHLLLRLPAVQDKTLFDASMVKRHARTFVALCTGEYKFSTYTPSMIASASIAAALDGLDWTSKTGCSRSQLLDTLHRITSIEPDYLRSCLEQIEEMVTETINSRNISIQGANGSSSMQTHSSDPNNASGKVAEHEKAGTPTDVRDIHF